MKMEEKEIQLILQCVEVFMRYGIRSVTMDDLARNLSVSKKTLYKYVKDKNELVEKAIRIKTTGEKARIDEVCANSENAIDELFEITRQVTQNLQQMHPSIFFDLEKYYSDAWAAFQEHKKTYVYECIFKNLLRGKEEGLYRANLSPEIIAKTYIMRFDDMTNPDVFPPTEYSYSEVYLEFFRYHIRGIASEKGIAYLIEKVNKEQLN